MMNTKTPDPGEGRSPYEPKATSFGEALRTLRQVRGLSQAELSRRKTEDNRSVPQGSISNAERTPWPNMERSTWMTLLPLLDISWDDFLTLVVARWNGGEAANTRVRIIQAVQDLDDPLMLSEIHLAAARARRDAGLDPSPGKFYVDRIKDPAMHQTEDAESPRSTERPTGTE